MPVLDTMVLVYAALGVSEFADAARSCIAKSATIVVPDLAFAEFAESARRWVGQGAVSEADARSALTDLLATVDEVVELAGVSPRALALGLERDHPVYDTLFVAAAERHGTTVVTYDRRMLARFPERAVHVDDFLRELGA